MNFSSKKFLPIIAILLIATGTFYYLYTLYYQKTKEEKPVAFDTSPEAVKEKCLKDFGEMTEDEFLESIKVEKVQFSGNLTMEEVDEKMHEFDQAKVDYLICRARYTEDETFYDKAKEYILGERNISEETKKATANIVDMYQSSEVFNRETFIEMALGSLDDICSNKFIKTCISDIPKRELEDYKIEEANKQCQSFCGKINEYLKDQDKFQEEVVNIDNSSYPDESIVYKAAILYRFERYDSSLDFCNNLKNENNKDYCISIVDRIEKAKNGDICYHLKEKIESSICLK